MFLVRPEFDSKAPVLGSRTPGRPDRKVLRAAIPKNVSRLKESGSERPRVNGLPEARGHAPASTVWRARGIANGEKSGRDTERIAAVYMAMYYEAWESLARRSGESSGVIEALVSVDPYIGSLLVLSVKTHGLTALLTHSVCPTALRISKLTHEHTLGGCAWNLGRLG